MYSINYKFCLVLTIFLLSVVSAQEEQIEQEQLSQLEQQQQQQQLLQPIAENIFPSASGKILNQINPPVYEQIPVQQQPQYAQQQPQYAQQQQQQPRSVFPFTNLGQITNRNPMSKQFYGSQHSILQFNRQQHPKQIIIEQVLNDNNEPIQTSMSPQIEQLQQTQQPQQQVRQQQQQQQPQQQVRQHQQQQQQPFVGFREQQQYKQQQLILQQQQFQQQQQLLKDEQDHREQEEFEKSIQLHQEKSQQELNESNQQEVNIERADIPVAPIAPVLPTVSKPIQRNQQQQQQVKQQQPNVQQPNVQQPNVQQPKVQQPKQPKLLQSTTEKYQKSDKNIETTRATNHQYNNNDNNVNDQNVNNNVNDNIARESHEQDLNAHYSFDSSVQDTINDHSHTRQETRDGLSLTGMYSYSDGFFKRTVFYEADEGGYRVTKEEIEPIGDGPQFNAEGKADVSSSLGGSYSITANDYRRGIPKKFAPTELPADRVVAQ